MYLLSPHDFFENNLPDKSFNFIYTDPPFKSFSNVEWDKLDVPKFWRETNRLTEDNAAWVIFANDLFMKDLLVACPEHINFKFKITWVKGNVRNFKSWYNPLITTENILFFEKGQFRGLFKDGTVKEKYNRTGFGNKSLMRNQDYMKNTKNPNEHSYGMYENVWNIPYDKKEWRFHPVQKPFEIHYRIHKIFSHHKNLRMLDPFAGSGSLLCPFDDATGFEINGFDEHFDTVSDLYDDVFLKKKESQEKRKNKGKAML